MLRVGELAKRTGLTVRTLHHYEEIGLLRPSHRNGAGYRLYTRGDVERLAQILSLRSIGLPLDQIRSSLTDKQFSLERCLKLQITRLREQIDRQHQLVRRLEAIVEKLGTVELSVPELTRALEMMTMFEKYYTPEQLKQLEERAKLVGENRIKEVESEWNDLFARYREEMAKGTDPASETVQALALKSKSLIAEFTGGDAGIERSLSNMYRQEGGPQILSGHGCDVDQQLWDYMGAASKALEDPADS